MTIWEAFHAAERLIDKWESYFRLYERYFAPFQGRSCRLLEIGVSHGGSLQMWKAYLGPRAEIWGIDKDPRCADYEEEQIKIRIADQGSEAFWQEFLIGKGFDIVIDDGSHETSDQMRSFKAIWPHICPDGVYLVEDCHHYGGKYFIDWAKELIGNMDSIAFYHWVVVFEKKLHVNPLRMVSGRPSRPLNKQEIEAYGKIDAQYLHSDP